MGWVYNYLKGISKANRNDKCPKSKKGKKHKLDTWFGAPYCERCGVDL